MGHELSDIFVGSSLFGLGGRGTMRLIFVLTPAFKPPGLFHSFIHSFTKLALAHRKSTASGTNAALQFFHYGVIASFLLLYLLLIHYRQTLITRCSER